MISVVLILLLLLVLGVLSNALNIVAIAGIITVFGYKYPNIHKKAFITYVIAVVLSVLALVFYEESIFLYINKGLIGYAFLFIVMITGVIPSKWTLTRHLKRNRGVFSILSYILISPHAVSHVFGLLGGINIFGIAAYVVMLPLTIISFKVIRKEIEPKDWINIQKAAYIVYALLFIHLLMVASWENKIVYAVMFTLYINNKIVKEYKK